MEREWRCKACGKLLGILDGDRLEILFARGHQYHASLPVTCVCRNADCNTLNQLTNPRALETREASMKR